MKWLKWRKDEAPGTPQVLMYTLSVCPSCSKAKKFFTDRHIPFQFTNYDLADRATQDQILKEIEAEEVEGFPFVRMGGRPYRDTIQNDMPGCWASMDEHGRRLLFP